MNSSSVIAALRAYAHVFENRVYGAAKFDAAFKDSGAATLPAAYVVPLSDDVADVSDDKRTFKLIERFGVYIICDASADLRGDNAAASLEDLRTAIFDAILGYQPDELSGGVAYEGGELVSLDRPRLCWRFDFSVASLLTYSTARDEAVLAAFPALSGIDINVDIVDPAADPNTPPVTDPAQGGYHGGYPGPDGRIEHKLKIDLPTT